MYYSIQKLPEEDFHFAKIVTRQGRFVKWLSEDLFMLLEKSFKDHELEKVLEDSNG